MQNSLENKKITVYKDSIKSLSDRPYQNGITATELKALFDGRTDNEVKEKHNGLIDALAALGAEGMVVSGDLSRVKHIRLNSDNALEVSADGVQWEVSGSGGHLILDKSGNLLPQRARMRFGGSTQVYDQNGITVVEGIKGDRGDTGTQGDRGIQGLKGDIGKTGPVIVPEIDKNGVMSFTVQDTAIEPNAVSVRGPQGVQGVQGLQGVAGSPGVQGIQGVQGVQGVRGERGNTGDRGEVGSTGVAGIQGMQGTAGPRGDRGERGAVGQKGDSGAQGPIGPQGNQGIAGTDGRSFTIQDVYATLGQLKLAFPTGNEWAYQVSADKNIYIWSEITSQWTALGQLQGPIGPQGIQGVTGEKGDRGDTGAKGEPGAQGVQGVAGAQGVEGQKGEKGDRGDPGEVGAEGVQGVQGTRGPQGPQGIQGVAGQAGKSAYTSAVEGGYTSPESAFNVDLASIPNKVDKVAGKGLSSSDFTAAEKAKLGGIAAGANAYVHPSTHPAAMITETTAKRFVSDAEKAGWNEGVKKNRIGDTLVSASAIPPPGYAPYDGRQLLPESEFPALHAALRTTTVRIDRPTRYVSNRESALVVDVVGGAYVNTKSLTDSNREQPLYVIGAEYRNTTARPVAEYAYPVRTSSGKLLGSGGTSVVEYQGINFELVGTVPSGYTDLIAVEDGLGNVYAWTSNEQAKVQLTMFTKSGKVFVPNVFTRSQTAHSLPSIKLLADGAIPDGTIGVSAATGYVLVKNGVVTQTVPTNETYITFDALGGAYWVTYNGQSGGYRLFYCPKGGTTSVSVQSNVYNNMPMAPDAWGNVFCQINLDSSRSLVRLRAGKQYAMTGLMPEVDAQSSVMSSTKASYISQVKSGFPSTYKTYYIASDGATPVLMTGLSEFQLADKLGNVYAKRDTQLVKVRNGVATDVVGVLAPTRIWSLPDSTFYTCIPAGLDKFTVMVIRDGIAKAVPLVTPAYADTSSYPRPLVVPDGQGGWYYSTKVNSGNDYLTHTGKIRQRLTPGVYTYIKVE